MGALVQPFIGIMFDRIGLARFYTMTNIVMATTLVLMNTEYIRILVVISLSYLCC